MQTPHRGVAKTFIGWRVITNHFAGNKGLGQVALGEAAESDDLSGSA